MKPILELDNDLIVSEGSGLSRDAVLNGFRYAARSSSPQSLPTSKTDIIAADIAKTDSPSSRPVRVKRMRSNGRAFQSRPI